MRMTTRKACLAPTGCAAVENAAVEDVILMLLIGHGCFYSRASLKLPRSHYRRWYLMAKELGVGIKLPAVSPQPYTALAFEGYQHAKAHGPKMAQSYNDRLLRAFFSSGGSGHRRHCNAGTIGHRNRSGTSQVSASTAKNITTVRLTRLHYSGLINCIFVRCRHLFIGDRISPGVHSAQVLCEIIKKAQDSSH